MSIFTSLLFFFTALALLPLALRNNSACEGRRQKKRDTERMTIGAQICEAAARDAFEAELDHSIGSISPLDSLITLGWSNKTDVTNASMRGGYDPTFAMGTYVGDLFVRVGNAEWIFEDGTAFMYVRASKQKFFPFDLIQRKLWEPDRVNLQEEMALWLNLATRQEDYGNANT
jgi:hypothetical protein